MKPNTYWYSKLTLIEKLEWRSAMREFGKDEKRYLEDTSSTFCDFIDYSFHWAKTDQGSDYWEIIAYSDRSNDKFTNIMLNKITFNNEINGNKSMVFS